MAHPDLSAASARVADLKPYPGNPRRGDIEAIAESLRVNGQFKPVVVRRADGLVLAGNHTVAAARSLGWERVAVVYVEADDAQARRIMLADNRTSDLAFYNEPALLDLLRSLPDLDGTGFVQADLDRLDGLFTDAPPLDSPTGGLLPSNGPGKATGGRERPEQDEVGVHIGPYRLAVERAPYGAWADAVLGEAGGKKARAVEEVRRRLRLADAPRQQRPPAPPEDRVTMTGLETVPLSSLAPYPANPREGDVGAIMESLMVNGQYRPIVCNRRDRTILVGNHTAQAAAALGWESISVAWVDVDDEQAARIVLADNRTADLAIYDDGALRDALAALDGWAGSCFTPEDLADLAAGSPGRPGPDQSGKTRCSVGEWRFHVKPETWARFSSALPDSYADACWEIAHRLHLPDTWRTDGGTP